MELRYEYPEASKIIEQALLDYIVEKGNKAFLPKSKQLKPLSIIKDIKIDFNEIPYSIFDFERNGFDSHAINIAEGLLEEAIDNYEKENGCLLDNDERNQSSFYKPL